MYINEFKKKGYLPQSIINNLILLGWSPKKDDENIEIKEIIKTFELEKMSKSSSFFDYNKLNHFNNFYLQKEENYKYFERYINENSILKTFFNLDQIKMKKLFSIYKKNIITFIRNNPVPTTGGKAAGGAAPGLGAARQAAAPAPAPKARKRVVETDL